MEAANSAAGTSKPDMTELTKSALLLVVGEPFTTDHRDLILKEITEGKHSFVELQGQRERKHALPVCRRYSLRGGIRQ